MDFVFLFSLSFFVLTLQNISIISQQQEFLPPVHRQTLPSHWLHLPKKKKKTETMTLREDLICNYEYFQRYNRLWISIRKTIFHEAVFCDCCIFATGFLIH